MPEAGRSLRVYRWLQRLYPAGFRESYGGPMERAFRDELEECTGGWERAGLWGRVLGDLAVSVPAQFAREVGQDARHTLRLWGGRPQHTGLAVAALAIGMGGSTGVFSVVNALLLRSLPFVEPGRLASMSPQEFIPPHDSATQFAEWRKGSSYLADAALVEEGDANVGSLRAHVAQTAGDFFSVLGVNPVVGRAFRADEDADAVAVIGYGVWQQAFAGDRGAVSSTIRVDGQELTIVGVAPPGFDYPGGAVVWRPAKLSAGNNGWETVARLKPGLDWRQARAAFEAEPTGEPGRRRELRSLQDRLAGPAKEGSMLLLAGVGLILLIACANVASLLMARMADRAGELSIRAALGASRARLMQQILTECLLLSALGAVAGMVVASLTVSLATRVQPPPLAAQAYSLLDGRVLGFTMLLSVGSGVFFGVCPALCVGRGRPQGTRRVLNILVGSQVMLTVVLLVASVSLGRAFWHLMANERGYEVTSVVTVNVSLEGTRHNQLAYFEEAVARVRALPGVRSASATEFLPLYADGFMGGPFGLDGRRAKRNSTVVPVMAGYFQTMGATVLQGREFTDAEVRSGAAVAMVNERFAEGFGGPSAVVGHQLTVRGRVPSRIVGVVKGMEYETDPSLARGNQVFIPSVAPGGFFSTIVARVEGRAEDSLALVRDTIRGVDPGVAVFGVKTMEQRLDEVFARPKFYRTAVWLFAGVAFVLAMIGVYGIVASTVAQRTRELGVRMALGSTPMRLRSMLLRQGLLVVVTGAGAGMVGARLGGWVLGNLLAGAGEVDLAVCGGAGLFLVVLSAVSIWVATRRLRRIDVVMALRGE